MTDFSAIKVAIGTLAALILAVPATSIGRGAPADPLSLPNFFATRMGRPATVVFTEMTAQFGGEASKSNRSSGSRPETVSYEFQWEVPQGMAGYYEIEAYSLNGNLASVRLKWSGAPIFAILEETFGASAQNTCWNNPRGRPCPSFESGARLSKIPTGCIRYMQGTDKFRVLSSEMCLYELAGNGDCAESCQKDGQCLKTASGCKASSALLCEMSEGCQKHGRCGLVKQNCGRTDGRPSPEEVQQASLLELSSVPLEPQVAAEISRNTNPPWGAGFVLIWQKQVPHSLMTQSEAKQYCKRLRLGGLKGWSLPALGQLGSVVSIWNGEPTVPGEKRCRWLDDGQGPCGEYWTSNFGEECWQMKGGGRGCGPDKNLGTVLDISTGNKANRPLDYKARVRCMHEDEPKLFDKKP